MSVASMTGFARGTGQDGPLTWTWEVKSVNGRGLDIRCRLPNGMDSLDPAVRRAVGERFKRGSIVLMLQTDRAAGEGRLRVNREAFDQLVGLLDDLRGTAKTAPPSLDGLLRVRGIVDLVDDDETPEVRERHQELMTVSLAETLDALAAARREEGARIATVLDGQIDEIAALAAKAADCAALQPEALRKRLAEQVAEVLATSPPLPEERLAQEVALLLVKADVREEVDRLRAHVAAARELIAEGGPVGRRLDFLCQEFNREANTLCSKAADVELTRIGLDLKAVIDQFREQVQNVE
ncbi:MAG: YicC/YloC family endoribonuclease [Alphaproteobacteria bacterium]